MKFSTDLPPTNIMRPAAVNAAATRLANLWSGLASELTRNLRSACLLCSVAKRKVELGEYVEIQIYHTLCSQTVFRIFLTLLTIWGEGLFQPRRICSAGDALECAQSSL